jgi:hypothetical protein
MRRTGLRKPRRKALGLPVASLVRVPEELTNGPPQTPPFDPAKQIETPARFIGIGKAPNELRVSVTDGQLNLVGDFGPGARRPAEWPPFRTVGDLLLHVVSYRTTSRSRKDLQSERAPRSLLYRPDPALIGAFPERLAKRTSKRGRPLKVRVVERPRHHIGLAPPHPRRFVLISRHRNDDVVVVVMMVMTMTIIVVAMMMVMVVMMIIILRQLDRLAVNRAAPLLLGSEHARGVRDGVQQFGESLRWL